MNQEKLLKTLEGLHTIETVMEALNLKRQSAINIISKLKKEGYVTTSGGPRKHLYKITPYKQRPRRDGMFDLLNRYNKNFRLSPWYDHQVHGRYRVEDAILDAIDTKSFRAILATLRLFNHIKDWPYLYREAKKRESWQKVGALCDVGRAHFKMGRMPKHYSAPHTKEWNQMTRLNDRGNFPPIAKKWKVFIPFNEHDVMEV